MKKLVEKIKQKKIVGLMSVAMLALATLPTAAGAAPIEFTGQTVGVSVGDAVATGFNFMGMFDEWTLLVAGLILAPVAIGFLLWILNKAPKQKTKS